mgnify:CR=1 FL=1
MVASHLDIKKLKDVFSYDENTLHVSLTQTMVIDQAEFIRTVWSKQTSNYHIPPFPLVDFQVHYISPNDVYLLTWA